MPTIKQLNLIWQAQQVIFGGPGEPKQSYVSSDNEHGLAMNQINEVPVIPQNRLHESKGEIIGHVEFNEETDSLKIVPLKLDK